MSCDYCWPGNCYGKCVDTEEERLREAFEADRIAEERRKHYELVEAFVRSLDHLK